MKRFLIPMTLILTSCFEGGASFPLGKSGYCMGVGLGTGEGKLEWLDIELNECIPEGYYGCDQIDVNYDGAFGGASCQGAYDFPDSYTMSFVTSREVTLAVVSWETDMMDSSFNEILYPVWVGDSNYEFVMHFPNPGYGSDGDQIDYSIDVYIGNTLIADPVVSATLDGVPEDVDYDARDREYSSRW